MCPPAAPPQNCQILTGDICSQVKTFRLRRNAEVFYAFCNGLLFFFWLLDGVGEWLRRHRHVDPAL